MRTRNAWIAKAAAVAVVAWVGIAALSAPGAQVGPATTGGSAGPAICADPGPGRPFTPAATRADRRGEFAAPEALCKLRPECWSNSDCDARCGTGLGKCVHSHCPIRICVCK